MNFLTDQNGWLRARSVVSDMWNKWKILKDTLRVSFCHAALAPRIFCKCNWGRPSHDQKRPKNPHFDDRFRHRQGETRRSLSCLSIRAHLSESQLAGLYTFCKQKQSRKACLTLSFANQRRWRSCVAWYHRLIPVLVCPSCRKEACVSGRTPVAWSAFQQETRGNPQ